MSATPTATYSLHYTATTSQPLTATRAAAQIFGPELYPLYINWQTDIEDPEQAALYPSRSVWRRIIQAVRQEEVGGMPSAHTFKAFMNTKRVKKQLYMQDAEDYMTDEDGEDEEERKEGNPDLLITRLCKHPVHPGNPWMNDVCPRCLMSQCIASLDRIAHVWRLVGGPLKPCRSGDTGALQIYHAARRIWHTEKVRWANLVDIYEQCAEEEVLWEEDSCQDGLAIPVLVTGSSSCMEALELAMLTPFLAEGWSEIFVPKSRLELRHVGGESQGTSVAGDKETEIPYFPLNSPEPEQEALRYLDGTSDRSVKSDKQNENGINGANTTLSPFNKPTVAPRSPSTSSDSSIYTPSPPPIPPSSPPQTLSQLHSSSPPILGVSFPDDLPSPPSRRSIYYQRSSPSYNPGKYASPSGSVWLNTSFMSDCNDDHLGGTQDEDEELEEHGNGWNDYDDEVLKTRGRDSIGDGLNMVLQKEAEEEEETEGDWSDENDFDDDEDDEEDLIVHAGRETVGQKRLPGQVTGLNIRRPVFSFSWQKRSELEEIDETNDDAMSDEFEDEEVEQAMRDLDPKAMEAPTEPTANTDMPMVSSGGAEEMGTVSLAGPVTQVSPRCRSHDEFNEFGQTDEEDHVKRHCHKRGSR